LYKELLIWYNINKKNDLGWVNDIHKKRKAGVGHLLFFYFIAVINVATATINDAIAATTFTKFSTLSFVGCDNDIHLPPLIEG